MTNRIVDAALMMQIRHLADRIIQTAALASTHGPTLSVALKIMVADKLAGIVYDTEHEMARMLVAITTDNKVPGDLPRDAVPNLRASEN